MVSSSSKTSSSKTSVPTSASATSSSKSSKTSQSNSNNNNGRNLLPILIIPGFMSSGLEVTESTLKPGWVGKRIWINLQSLGFQSVYWGSAQKNSNNSKMNQKEQAAQLNYKSSWIKHMTLNVKDMKTESPGIKVRPIDGLEGVDYLSPGALTNHVSYVFGPVIRALQDAGYNTGDTYTSTSSPSSTTKKTPPNLAASPYDWRIMPLELERRDKYFTKTMKLVEQLYNDNHDTPVVVMGHSLGCKTAHYFLNFAHQKKGQSWIDKYIHTYMPVGAPHLGAPKALRSVISGDKMSLDAFLNDEEALVLGRSLGSGPWLIPEGLPNGVPASAYILPHGVLRISFTHACDANVFVNRRENLQRPTKYQLQVVGRGLHGNINERRVVRTPFHKVSTDLGPDVVNFTKDVMSFGTLQQPVTGATLHFLLQEPGIGVTKKEKNDRGCCTPACCIATLFCCCICALIYKILKCLTCGLIRAGALAADGITSGAGSGTTLAFSEAVTIPPNVWKGDTVTMKVPLFHHDDYGETEGCCGVRLKDPRKTYIFVKMRWLPYDNKLSFKKVCSPVCQPADDAPNLPIKHKKGGGLFQQFPGYDLIEREGLRTTTLQCIKDSYDRDPLGPRTLSSEEPPPIKRIHAIYGVNLPTEIGGAYKRKDTCVSDTRLESLYEPDNKATIDKESTGYLMKGGLLFETPQSKQRVIGSNKIREVSGDGTVPFWSLEHSKSWNGIDGRIVTVQELEKAEHREILADPRFHQAVIAYCSK